MRNEFVPVDVLAYSVRQERIENNQQKLKSIVKTVIFSGQHDIALHGHKDDSKYYDSTSNVGNFQGLLNFRAECGDVILEEHFQTCPKNVAYLSKTVQNKLIEI